MPDQRTAGTAPRLFNFFVKAGARLAGRREIASVASLTRQLHEKDRAMEAQAAALAHSRKIFARASEAARIGVWECNLPEETLHWTDVVYEIFDMPRDARLDRTTTLACYTEASALELKRRRSQAIAERSGFSMDAEIVTAKGNRRWMRITATVECEGDVPVRIFGIKQDITEAKNLFDRTRYLADFDLMTGLANRAQFQTSLAEFCNDYAAPGLNAALLLIDLDGFKAVNDTYGHTCGDDCLKEAADRLRAVCGNAKLIARIGGDEFAVLLQPDADPRTLAELAQDIVQILRRPIQLSDRRLQIGASVGLAPVDGLAPSDFFQRADMALYAAKNAGRNTFHIAEATGRPSQQAPRNAA